MVAAITGLLFRWGAASFHSASLGRDNFMDTFAENESQLTVDTCNNETVVLSHFRNRNSCSSPSGLVRSIDFERTTSLRTVEIRREANVVLENKMHSKSRDCSRRNILLIYGIWHKLHLRRQQILGYVHNENYNKTGKTRRKERKKKKEK